MRPSLRRALPPPAGLLLAFFLTGCAQVGPVRPPSAQLPRPVTDLRAVRSGPVVELAWSAPRMTSDGVALRAAATYNLCVWPGQVTPRPAPPAPPAPKPEMNPPTAPQVPSPPPRDIGGSETPAGAFMPPCPDLRPLAGHQMAAAALGRGGLATLALYAVNPEGAGAGWSNPVVVSLFPVAPAPALAPPALTAQGVALTWALPQPPPAQIAVFRQLPPAAAVQIALLPGDAGGFRDDSVAWNQHYQYWLRSLAGSGATRVASADSNHESIATAEVFPPPVPAGLQVVAGAAGVDLSWDTVNARDMAGYNVYRQSPAGGGWEKRNPAPLPTPVFHDARPPGAARYAVTAVDGAGNESQKSASVAVAAGAGARPASLR